MFPEILPYYFNSIYSNCISPNTLQQYQTEIYLLDDFSEFTEPKKESIHTCTYLNDPPHLRIGKTDTIVKRRRVGNR